MLILDMLKWCWQTGFLPFVAGGGTSIPTINNSLRFRASASAYLSRTPASAGDRTTWTWSGWVKRGTLGVEQTLFSADTNSSNVCKFGFSNITASTDEFTFIQTSAGTAVARKEATFLMRDPSAWYHVVVIWDSTNGTAADRVRFYINNNRITTFTGTNTDPSASLASLINNNQVHNIGRSPIPSGSFDGELARVCFVDGQALAPSSFAYTDPLTDRWVSKSQSACAAVVNAGGANGFMLDFDNGSSLTTLGYDKSSKGNNWTLNNFSLTAGATYDWFTDTPTNNYCVLNAIDPSFMSTGTRTITNGNLTSSDAGTSSGLHAKGNITVSSGKWYWEVNCTSIGSTFANIGIVQETGTAGKFYQSAGAINNAAVSGGGTAYGATYATGDVIGVALDMDAGTLVFYKNGVSQGTAATGLTGPYTAGLGDAQNTSQYTFDINFGQRPFAYTPPTGFKSLCTANLPEPTGAAKRPKNHFGIKLRSGTNAVANITGYPFQPDFVWVKSRNQATVHYLFNSVNGATKYLSSSSNAAEATLSDSLTSFNSDGYSLGADTNNGINWTSGTYVDWAFKAGGAAVTNNAGSIASQVSANVTAGFSIVTWTGTGASGTVGHGLGAVPKLIIVKNRQPGSALNWLVWHSGMAAGDTFANLNTTAAQVTSTGDIWGSTTPTRNTTIFSIGNNATGNESGKSILAYCFAEIPGFSKFGSYTGNGSTDGPFVNLGFRPRFIMMKRIDSTSNWWIEDTARSPINSASAQLFPDLSAAEGTNLPIDILSNGFKIRHSVTQYNASGGTYIFAAFAEFPFQYANAR